MKSPEVKKMKKMSPSIGSLGLAAAFCAALLVACGGGSGNPDNLGKTPGSQSGGSSGGSASEPPNRGGDAPESSPAVLDVVGADENCVPAVPTNEQDIVLDVVSVDGQGLYPIGNGEITYRVRGADGFTIDSSNTIAYYPSPLSGNYAPSGDFINPAYPTAVVKNPDTGEIVTPGFDAEVDSIISFEPADWMQRAARSPNLAKVGDSYILPMRLKAKGLLPYTVAGLFGEATDAEGNAINAFFEAKITRIDDGPVGVVANACRYEVELSRPDIVLDEDAALASWSLSGVDLEPLYADINNRLQLESYMPMLEGTFATSSEVPLVPVRSEFRHTYGVASATTTDNKTTSKGNIALGKALDPIAPSAQQTITFARVE